MMTPEEKAKEIVDAMYEVNPFEYGNRNGFTYDQAKQYAIIAIDLKLTPLETEFMGNWTTHIMSHSEIVFWNKVKQAVEL